MAAMIWDKQSQAWTDAETPLVYDPASDAFVDTTGLVWDEEAKAWKEVWSKDNRLYLYTPGDTHVDVTGGYKFWYSSTNNCDVTETGEYLRLYHSNMCGGNVIYVTSNKIDLTKYKTLNCMSDGYMDAYGHGIIGGQIFLTAYETFQGWDKTKGCNVPINLATTEFDVSDLSGLYYVGFSMTAKDSATMTIYQFWLE